MTAPPKRPDPPIAGPDLEPGASDLLKGLLKGSRADDETPIARPASAADLGEDPEAIGRTTTEYDGGGGASSSLESSDASPASALDLPITRSDERRGPGAATAAVARRETRRLELSDIEPTRPNIVGSEPEARLGIEPAADEPEPPTGNGSTSTVPSAVVPDASPAGPAALRDRAEVTLAIAKRETTRLPLSDAEPTRPAIVDPELVRSSVTVETAVALALTQSFDDEESDLDLTKPVVPGPDQASQVPPAPAASVSSAPTPIARPVEAESPEPVTPEPPAPIASPQPAALAPRSPARAEAPDPDATGKLDGLPPFALLERIATFRRDPDETNRFVKRTALEAPEIAREPAPSSAGPALPPVSPQPAPARPVPAVAARQPGPDASDASLAPPSPRRRVSLSIFLAFNALSLVLGFASGALLVILAVRYELAPPFAADLGPAAERPGLTDRSAVAPAADARPIATPPEPDAASPPDAGTTWTTLPNALVMPVDYRPGRAQPEAADEGVLRRIAEAISASPDLRVELIGHAAALDAVTGDEAETLALRRAESALEKIRAFGPSRRRFFTRVARDDEPMLEPTPTPSGLLRAVDLRVVQR